MTITRVGIMGGGARGLAFAKALARVGVCSVISEDEREAVPVSRRIAGLEEWVSVSTLAAAAEEDVVFLSVAWPDLGEALAMNADWEGRILIDATNPISTGPGLSDVGPLTSSEIVRQSSPGAHLVKAFGHLTPELLAVEPQQAGGRPVIFLAGDYSRAKIEVGRLVAQMAFAAIDLGGLVSGGRLLQSPDGPLWGQDLVKVGL